MRPAVRLPSALRRTRLSARGGRRRKWRLPDGEKFRFLVDGSGFRFTLDPTAEQARALAHFGPAARLQLDRRHPESRYRRLAGDRGSRVAKPSLQVIARKRWNTVKNDVCASTSRPVLCGGPECSKEAYRRLVLTARSTRTGTGRAIRQT